MQKALIATALALTLAGCETSPVEKCERSVSRKMVENQEQIDIVEENINRGYALAASRVSVGVNACASPIPNVSICAGGGRDIAPAHRPIDLAAEQAKLAALRAERLQLTSSHAQCASYNQ